MYCIFICIYIYETTLKQQFYKTIFESWGLSDQQLYPSKLDFVTQPWSMDAGKRRRWMSRFMAKQMPRPETQPTNEQESTLKKQRLGPFHWCHPTCWLLSVLMVRAGGMFLDAQFNQHRFFW